MNVESLLKYPLILLAAFVVTSILTPLWIRFAERLGFIDQPGGRKQHAGPVPVAGGLALALGFHAGCALIYLLPWQPFRGQLPVQWWYTFVCVSAAVVALGLWDDRVGAKPLAKLGGQIAIALLAYQFDLRVQNVLGFALPVWLDLTGTVLWFVLLMNAFNLIDGVDGLATGIGAIAALGIAVSLAIRHSPGDVLLLLSLVGACLGFLRFNFQPARVFLGDTGSLFIGFSIAALSLATRSKAPAIAALGMPLLAVGVPLFDTLLAIWRRSVRRYAPSPEHADKVAVHRADADHLHHRLVRRGYPVRRVALILYMATILLTVIGLSATVFYDRFAGILAVAFVCAAYTIIRHAASIELRESGRAVLRGIHRPVRRNRTMMLYLLTDLVILSVSSLLTMILLRGPEALSSHAGRSLWMQIGGLDIAITTLLLLGFRSYSRVWYLARVSEYAAVGLAVVLGGVVSAAIRVLIEGANAPGFRDLAVQSLLFCVFAAPGVLGVRVVLRVVQDLMQWRSIHDASSKERVSVLVAGTGYRTTLFLRQHNWNPDVGPAERIAGLVSDDPEMKGHFIHGHRVLGTVRELPALIAQLHPVRIYIVEDFDEAAMHRIRAAASSGSVRVTRWKMEEEDLPPVESRPGATIRRETDE